MSGFYVKTAMKSQLKRSNKLEVCKYEPLNVDMHVDKIEMEIIILKMHVEKIEMELILEK